MKFGLPEASLVLLAAGIVVSVLAMFDSTGLSDGPVPGALMVPGYIMIIAGIAAFEVCSRRNRSAIADYENDRAISAELSRFPDDGFLIDLTGEYKADNGAAIEDLTEGR
ncbi:hypothetical protein AUQ37_02950 [Candidatus Methanomethylophilus sp. 1R26]|uniref:hypothetical protein n=1 Tax=Candidatus Methanomethylophilus sp. 1R26 TaxID=1769296 RepID=UPI000737A0CE|nr:hypothetical protein [Candidatus Methanomethylophilus sp. 1R26]KUE73223.1 hypothetical protein AUQ37_02950 [Candidatus Methanomethylophilus sp. 1R26]TQS82637.1 MAG: hypothetical protein A3Q59_03885 [Methanomethylophilus alvi]